MNETQKRKLEYERLEIVTTPPKTLKMFNFPNHLTPPSNSFDESLLSGSQVLKNMKSKIELKETDVIHQSIGDYEEHNEFPKKNLDAQFDDNLLLPIIINKNKDIEISENIDQERRSSIFFDPQQVIPKFDPFEDVEELNLLRSHFDSKFDNKLASQSLLKLDDTVKVKDKNIAADFLKIEQDLAQHLLGVDYSNTKVKFISNPIEHAIEPHTNFLETYLNGTKPILFLGMNPGPWGMCQTGIPFGEVQLCKNWLNIKGNVLKPENTHPKRPIEGFACKRREVSGERFWRFFEAKCENPQTFFRKCFVYNHCPLAYMSETGKNITPPEFKAETKIMINNLCDKALADVIRLLRVTHVVGIGKFAEARANFIKKKFNMDISVFFLMHPSPANPAANKGWSDIAEKSLKNMNILDFL